MRKGQMWVAFLSTVCTVTERHISRKEVNPGKSKQSTHFVVKLPAAGGGMGKSFWDCNFWPEEGSVNVHVRTVLHTGTNDKQS